MAITFPSLSSLFAFSCLLSGKIIIKLTCINEDHDIADRPRRFDEANKNGLDIFRMDVI